MSSRRSARQLIVAVLLGVLVGGGLMAITPAGAQVNQALETNWKKIWKKELKPLANKSYYKKSQSDAKYASKSESAAAAAAAQAAAGTATDTKLGSYYKKTESDAKYVAAKRSTTGMFVAADYASAASEVAWDTIEYGQTLAAAPTSVVVAVGGSDARCPGNVENPAASPGFLCVFQATATNASNFTIYNSTGNVGTSKHGALLRISAVAAGLYIIRGSWAVTPAA